VPPTATPSSTPTGNCTLYSAPLFSSVSQTDLQAIGYYATKPNTTVTAAFSTGSPAYPAMAELFVVQSNYTIKITSVMGTLVGGQYQYTFNDGPYGLAALGFFVPGSANVGTSSETGTCGGPSSTVSWQVTKGDPDDHNGSTDVDDVLPGPTNSASMSSAVAKVVRTATSHARHGVATATSNQTYTWTFTINGQKIVYTFTA
jgi:hypothetical protein